MKCLKHEWKFQRGLKFKVHRYKTNFKSQLNVKYNVLNEIYKGNSIYILIINLKVKNQNYF